MERSEIRERWCKLLDRPRISLTLHAGYELQILSGRPRESGDPVNFGHSIWCSSQSLMLVFTGSRLSRRRRSAGMTSWLLLESNNIGPCLRLWARGSPAFLSFRFPLRRGGRRADKAHGLDYARPARERVTPGRARIAGLWA